MMSKSSSSSPKGFTRTSATCFKRTNPVNTNGSHRMNFEMKIPPVEVLSKPNTRIYRKIHQVSLTFNVFQLHLHVSFMDLVAYLQPSDVE